MTANVTQDELDKLADAGRKAYDDPDAYRSPVLNAYVNELLQEKRPEVGDGTARAIFTAFTDGWDKAATERLLADVDKAEPEVDPPMSNLAFDAHGGLEVDR